MSALNAPLKATATTSPATSPASTASFNVLNQQEFMQLLIAQLQHQDPTNPLQQQQLASEMALFSTATGINTLNDQVTQLAAAQNASAVAMAAGLIGKQVTTSGNALVTDSKGAATGAFTLANAAKTVDVAVLDASGKTVDHVSLGTLGPGIHTFAWSNGAANQAYQFNVTALDANGNMVNATTSSLYTVSGVSASGNTVELNLAGNPVPLSLSNIQQVL